MYFDTLCNVGKGELNTYHTLSTCKNLEYLVLDNVNVDFVVENVNDAERGIPAETKILVPRAALDAYKADSHWSSAADRILAMENFDIVRKDGVVIVRPKAVYGMFEKVNIPDCIVIIGLVTALILAIYS